MHYLKVFYFWASVIHRLYKWICFSLFNNYVHLSTKVHYWEVSLILIHATAIISLVPLNSRDGRSTLPLRTADSLSVKRNLQLRTSNVPPICTADLKCSVSLAYSDAVNLQSFSYGSFSGLFNKLICLFISFHFMRRMFFRWRPNRDFEMQSPVYAVILVVVLILFFHGQDLYLIWLFFENLIFRLWFYCVYLDYIWDLTDTTNLLPAYTLA